MIRPFSTYFAYKMNPYRLNRGEIHVGIVYENRLNPFLPFE